MFFTFTAFDNPCSTANFPLISGGTRFLIILSHSYKSFLAYLNTAIASDFQDLSSLIVGVFVDVATGDKTTVLWSTTCTMVSQALVFWLHLKLEPNTKTRIGLIETWHLKTSDFFFFSLFPPFTHGFLNHFDLS